MILFLVFSDICSRFCFSRRWLKRTLLTLLKIERASTRRWKLMWTNTETEVRRVPKHDNVYVMELLNDFIAHL